jgi:hypothetical protein
MKPTIGSSRLRRVAASAIAVITVSAVMVTGGATEAQAGLTQQWDSFEGSTPWTRWQGSSSGDGVVGYDIDKGVAHSDKNNGWLAVGNGWAANRIPVNLDGFNHRSDCAVGLYVNVLASGAQVGLQVWNPDGWHVIAQQYPWVDGNGSGYHVVNITGLNLQGLSGDIYVQAIYGNYNGTKTFVRIDDMVLECSS